MIRPTHSLKTLLNVGVLDCCSVMVEGESVSSFLIRYINVNENLAKDIHFSAKTNITNP